ncbi:upstrm_HI1419, putative addiction module killer protein [Burkholderiaceae bacterium]
MVQVYRYKTEAGAEPVTEWLLSLKDNLVQAKMRLRINRVAEGNFGDCSSVGDGVSELREHIGAGFRMYFGQQGKTIVILLCGGTKRTQTSDINTAKRYWTDWKKRQS